jgi:hypothetical protein
MAADVVTIYNRSRGPVTLAQGIVLLPGRSHIIFQHELINVRGFADNLAKNVAAKVISALTAEGEELTPLRIRALGRGIHAHTHDTDVGVDPLTDQIFGLLNDLVYEVSGAIVYIGDGEPVLRS